MKDWNAAPILSARNLTRRYGEHIGCRDVSFDLWPGEVLGIGNNLEEALYKGRHRGRIRVGQKYAPEHAFGTHGTDLRNDRLPRRRRA